jgi:predicted metal-binding membrane protein
LSEASAAPPNALSERIARNERWIVLAALLLATALGLFATLRLGDRLMMPDAPEPASIAYAALLFAMWWTMMMAMMLPSAAPAILTYGAMRRKFQSKGIDQPLLAVFVAGYAAIWTGFSLAAVILQIATRNVLPLTGMMAVTSEIIGSLLLVGAGLYQLTPLKYACLRKCQSPFMFFARNWRQGMAGAFRMGIDHGLYCLGCCWVLMGLLFYGGVMEPLWIAGLALYVLAEKLILPLFRLPQIAGLLLVGWGVWIFAAAISVQFS